MAWSAKTLQAFFFRMTRFPSLVLKCSAIAVLASAPTPLLPQAPLPLERARDLIARGQLADATVTLESFLHQHPGNADAWSLLGVAHAQQSESAKAEECFQKALTIEPHLASAGMNLGHLLLEEKRPSEALPYLKEAMHGDPSNNELRNMFVSAAEGTALEQRSHDDRDGALMTLLNAKAESPHSFPVLLDLSILEDELRLLRDADHDIHEARLIHPEDLKALYAEARVKMDLQNISAAEQDMRAYLKARPEDATAHYGLGRILQMAQRPAQAKAEFERSIQLSPNQSESYYEMGQIALDNGEYDEAKRQARKALDRNPKHGGALAVVGIADFRLKQYDDAVQSLQAAVTAAPEYQPARYYYGLALAKIGQKEASERELRVAAQMADEQNRREAQRSQLAPGASSVPPQR